MILKVLLFVALVVASAQAKSLPEDVSIDKLNEEAKDLHESNTKIRIQALVKCIFDLSCPKESRIREALERKALADHGSLNTLREMSMLVKDESSSLSSHKETLIGPLLPELALIQKGETLKNLPAEYLKDPLIVKFKEGLIREAQIVAKMVEKLNMTPPAQP